MRGQGRISCLTERHEMKRIDGGWTCLFRVIINGREQKYYQGTAYTMPTDGLKPVRIVPANKDGTPIEPKTEYFYKWPDGRDAWHGMRHVLYSSITKELEQRRAKA